VDSCGGAEHLAKVGALVETADRRGALVYPECIAPAMFALAALSAGNDDTAADYFAVPNAVAPVMATVAGIAVALLPPHARVPSTVLLDRDGVPDAAAAADSTPAARAAAALIESRNSTGGIAAADDALAALSTTDRIDVTLLLARTLAVHVMRD
jgi:hypothetical protein